MTICLGAYALEGGISEFSIDDCVEMAFKNDPNLVISKNFQKIAKSKIGLAKSDYFPNINAGGGFYIQNSNNSNVNYGTSSSNNYQQINLGINQLIWNFGKSTAKINMQKYNHESAGYDYDWALLSTAYRVKMAYYNVLAACANQDIYERSVHINELHYDRTKALFEEGLKSKIDVVNAEVYLTDAKIQLLNAENSYKIALVNLNNAMFYTQKEDYAIKNTESFNFHKSVPLKNEINVSYVVKGDENAAFLTSGIEKENILENYKFLPFDVSMEDAISEAYANRPDLKSLYMVERASKESLKAVKRMFAPEVGLTGGYTYRHSDSTTNNGLSTGVGINFPSLNLMGIKTQIDEAGYYLDNATNNIELTRKNIYFEVQNNYINMVQLEKRIPLMEEKVRQTLENFELADGRYSVGIGNFTELQDAQTNYNSAQLAYVQSIFNYNVSRVQLEKSMGVMWKKES